MRAELRLEEPRPLLRRGGGADASHPGGPSRARAAAKRGRNLCVTLDDALAATPARDIDILALDSALEELARLDPRQAQLVELRFFGGLTQAEAAQALDVSLATASREWATAKAWLYRRLKREDRRD